MADFTIKQNDWGDREPLRAVLSQLKVDEDGEPVLDGEGKEQFEPIDLTGCTVRILLESDGKARVKTSPMTGFDGAALGKGGEVEYEFEDGEGEEKGDLAVAGDYNMEFQIESAGGVQTVPNEGYLTLKIEPDLGPDE
jgi:hypothetical protein